jgi:hypothetical protein
MSDNDDFLMSLLAEEEILGSYCCVCNKERNRSNEFDICRNCNYTVCFDCMKSYYVSDIDDFTINCASCYASKNWLNYHFCINCKDLYFTTKYTKEYEKMIEHDTKRCKRCNELWNSIRLLLIGAIKNSDNNECRFNKLPFEIINHIINIFIYNY